MLLELCPTYRAGAISLNGKHVDQRVVMREPAELLPANRAGPAQSTRKMMAVGLGESSPSADTPSDPHKLTFILWTRRT